MKIDKCCCSNESIKYNNEEAAALKLMWQRKKLFHILVEEQTKEFCCNNSEKHNIQWGRISSSFEEASLMKNLLRSSFVCFSNAEGGYGRNFATTMTNWQMLQHWQAEYTCNKEEEAAALKLAYDKGPLPYLCFWISKVMLKPRKTNLLILILSLHSCKRIFLWCSWL